MTKTSDKNMFSAPLTTTYPTQDNRFHTVSAIRDDERGELERKAKAYDALETVMPECGHKARYVVSADEGTSWCALCVLSGLTSKKKRGKLS